MSIDYNQLAEGIKASETKLSRLQEQLLALEESRADLRQAIAETEDEIHRKRKSWVEMLGGELPDKRANMIGGGAIQYDSRKLEDIDSPAMRDLVERFHTQKAKICSHFAKDKGKSFFSTREIYDSSGVESSMGLGVVVNPNNFSLETIEYEIDKVTIWLEKQLSYSPEQIEEFKSDIKELNDIKDEMRSPNVFGGSMTSIPKGYRLDSYINNEPYRVAGKAVR